MNIEKLYDWIFILCTYLSLFSVTRVYYLFLVFALSGSSKSFERNIEMVSKVSISHRMAFDARGQSFRVSPREHVTTDLSINNFGAFITFELELLSFKPKKVTNLNVLDEYYLVWTFLMLVISISFLWRDDKSSSLLPLQWKLLIWSLLSGLWV